MSGSCGVISVEYCELLDADDVITSKRAEMGLDANLGGWMDGLAMWRR